MLFYASRESKQKIAIFVQAWLMAFAAFAALGHAASDSETDDVPVTAANVPVTAALVPVTAALVPVTAANLQNAFFRLDNPLLGRTQCIRPTGPPTQLQAVAKAWSKALSLCQGDNLANTFVHPDQTATSHMHKNA